MGAFRVNVHTKVGTINVRKKPMPFPSEYAFVGLCSETQEVSDAAKMEWND
jgi:hypothetical protein